MTAVSSAVGDRHTHRTAAVKNAHGGRRTLSVTPLTRRIYRVVARGLRLFSSCSRPLIREYAPPKLGGWGSEPLLTSSFVREYAPPKLGGWGSEQWLTLWLYTVNTSASFAL
ncbi:MAG: hypothetical protein HXL35_00475 [Prevotellaceae bacterium]|nr:hypothetical protein [Prevotellaceae bacterium]